MPTRGRYYHGSTVVPVVVPVFRMVFPVEFLTTFLYEMKVGQRWYGKPESGRTYGPKDKARGFMGRSGGRGQFCATKKKQSFFFPADLFCLKSYSVKSITSWCYYRVQACTGGKEEVFSTLVREIWTNITGFIVDLLTSLEKNSTF